MVEDRAKVIWPQCIPYHRAAICFAGRSPPSPPTRTTCEDGNRRTEFQTDRGRLIIAGRFPGHRRTRRGWRPEYFKPWVKQDIFAIPQEDKFKLHPAAAVRRSLVQQTARQAPPEAFANLEHVKALAKTREGAAGIGGVLLTFLMAHWTSPGHQEKRSGWAKKLQLETVTGKAVHDFNPTSDMSLENNAPRPIWLQLGNGKFPTACCSGLGRRSKTS